MARILKDDELDLPQLSWFLTVLVALCFTVVHHFVVLAYRQQKIVATEKVDEFNEKDPGDKEDVQIWYLELELTRHLEQKKRKLREAQLRKQQKKKFKDGLPTSPF